MNLDKMYDEGQKDKPYYSIKEVSELLGRHQVSIRNWIKAGRLEATNIGTKKQGVRYIISKESLDKFLGGR